MLSSPSLSPDGVWTPPPMGRAASGGTVRAAAAPLACLVLWAVGMGGVDLVAMDDLGLVSVLPVAVVVALAVLTASFSWVLCYQPGRTPVVLVHVVTLVVMLYGMAPIATRIVWRHMGVIEYLGSSGAVDPDIDAYFNWPGFFAVGALLRTLAGLADVGELARWAPVALNLAYLGPLVMLLRSATGDRRLVWLGVWIFYLGNWVGQDYFAPQALAYFFHLVILAILARWFSRAQDGGPAPAGASPVQRMALMAILLAIAAALVPSHQLTPFATLVSVAALVAWRCCNRRTLPLLLGVAVAAWGVFMAATYFDGHLADALGQVGAVGDSAQANLLGRIQGSPRHLAVVQVRMVVTAALWGLALLGWWRRRGMSGHRHMVVAGLAPFSLLGLQLYGGEMLLRVYLFTLPFAAFFAAAAVVGALRRSRSAVVVVALAGVVVCGAFTVARYGNTRLDHFSPEEVAAAEHLYRVAAPGSVLLAGSANLPWKDRAYAAYEYESLDLEPGLDTSVADLVDAAASRMALAGPDRAYLVLTRSQDVYANLLGLAPVGTVDRLGQALAASSRFRSIYANRDATIYVLASDG